LYSTHHTAYQYKLLRTRVVREARRREYKTLSQIIQLINTEINSLFLSNHTRNNLLIITNIHKIYSPSFQIIQLK